MPGVEAPTCPRCGYDLSGAAAAREASSDPSPSGTCSECGYIFQWPDVLEPDRWKLKGFFEHERKLLAPAWRTWLWTVFPWIYWKRVGMHHKIVAKRLWLWLVVLVLPFHLITSLAGSVAVIAVLENRNRIGRDWFDTIAQAAGPWLSPVLANGFGFSGVPYYFALSNWPAGLWVLIATSLAFPFLLLILGSSRRIAKVRAAHVARAAVYGMAWVVPLAALRTVREILGSANWVWMSYNMGAWRAARTPDYGPYWNAWQGMAAIWEHGWPWLVLPLLAWQCAWWLAVIGRAWKLDRPVLVWCVLLVPVLLLDCVVLCLQWDMKFLLWIA